MHMIKGSQEFRGTLYVVGTPIGNLDDISRRATTILGQVNIIAAEDTRVSRKLLAHLGIKKQVISHHRHNERESCARVLNLLKKGKSVALICDSGTPGISDPGALLVASAREVGLNICAIPGPSALSAALSISGFPTGNVHFHGFLPLKGLNRKEELEGLAKTSGIHVIFEAPHKLRRTLLDLSATLGATQEIVIVKEITKVFEQSHRLSLKQLLIKIENKDFLLLGEFVLLLWREYNPQNQFKEIDRSLTILLPKIALKEAVKVVVRLTGASRNIVYQRALNQQEKISGAKS